MKHALIISTLIISLQSFGGIARAQTATTNTGTFTPAYLQLYYPKNVTGADPSVLIRLSGHSTCTWLIIKPDDPLLDNKVLMTSNAIIGGKAMQATYLTGTVSGGYCENVSLFMLN